MFFFVVFFTFSLMQCTYAHALFLLIESNFFYYYWLNQPEHTHLNISIIKHSIICVQYNKFRIDLMPDSMLNGSIQFKIHSFLEHSKKRAYFIYEFYFYNSLFNSEWSFDLILCFLLFKNNEQIFVTKTKKPKIF